MTSALPVLDDARVASADRAARAWQGPSGVPVPIGSDAHKEFFCRMLLDTFNPYKPTIMDWPKLSEAERRRLGSLPIWDIAVATEGKARLAAHQEVEMPVDFFVDPRLGTDPATSDVPYSPAFLRSGIVWSPAALDRWLAGPQEFVPGAPMTLSITDPATRRDIIGFLEAQGVAASSHGDARSAGTS